MRGLVQAGMNLVLELLALRSQLEAHQVRLRMIVDRNLEGTVASSLSVEPALHFQGARDFLLDQDLDRFLQWIDHRCWCFLLLRRCFLGGRWVGSTHACKDVCWFLLPQSHALLWTSLGFVSRRAVIAHARIPSWSFLHGTQTHATTAARHRLLAEAASTTTSTAQASSTQAATCSTFAAAATSTTTAHAIAGAEASHGRHATRVVLGVQLSLLLQFHLLLVGHFTGLVDLALLDHLVQLLLVTVHLGVGLHLRERHALPVPKGDDFIEGEDDVQGILEDNFFVDLGLAAILHNLGQQPQCFEIFQDVAGSVRHQKKMKGLHRLIDVPHCLSLDEGMIPASVNELLECANEAFYAETCHFYELPCQERLARCHYCCAEDHHFLQVSGGSSPADC
mmetsp:Transcript_70597/g.147868  ORF Transcript_70597/g.147868 Transcript_70597/m.147868 type:complete len:394 (+) Transcript_70597:577-1758(+)